MEFRDDIFIASSPEDAAVCSQQPSILQSQASLPTQSGPLLNDGIEDSQATLGQHLQRVMVVGSPTSLESPEAEMRRAGGTPATPLHRLGSTDSVREPSQLFAPTPDTFAPTPEPIAVGLAAASSAEGCASRRPRPQEVTPSALSFSQSGAGQPSMASQESCREPAELFPSTPDHFEAPAVDGIHRGLPVQPPPEGISQCSAVVEASQFFGATPDSFEQGAQMSCRPEEPSWTQRQAPAAALPEPAAAEVGVLLPTSTPVPSLAAWLQPAAPDAGASADAGTQAAADAMPLTPPPTPPTGWSPHRLFSHAVATVAATGPDSNPRRRLRQKRSGPTTQTPERKRRLQQPSNGELAVQVPPATQPEQAVVGESEEEEWKRRQLHRRNGIDSVKRTKLYQVFAEARKAGFVGNTGAPKTPDPTDREVRKRRWENSMQSWRNGLKDWGRASGYNLSEL